MRLPSLAFLAGQVVSKANCCINIHTKTHKIDPPVLKVPQLAIENPGLIVPLIFEAVHRVDPAQSQKVGKRTNCTFVRKYKLDSEKNIPKGRQEITSPKIRKVLKIRLR
jgi:hypothetical protein